MYQNHANIVSVFVDLNNLYYYYYYSEKPDRILRGDFHELLADAA